jgi:hypothetical protein
MKPSMKPCFTGSVWRYHWGSSDFLYMAIPFLSFSKSTKHCNKETMHAYVQEVRKLESKFSGLEVHHVLREHNVGADTLSKLGSTRAQVPPGIFVQELK